MISRDLLPTGDYETVGVCVATFQIPDSTWVQRVFKGALLQSLYDYNWVKRGTMEIDDAVTLFNLIYWSYECLPAGSVGTVQPTYHIHPFSFELVSGAWSKTVTTDCANGYYINNLTATEGDKIQRKIFLPAGDYEIRTVHARYAVAGGIRVKIFTSVADEITVQDFDSYSASPLYNQLQSNTFTLASDYDGYISVEARTQAHGSSFILQDIIINKA